jgi:membrane protein YqaA with SNARE-associated domain
VVFKSAFLRLIRRLGGPGLIVLGLVDNSVIPLPGSMDAATVLLAATHREPWWYYALMALVGSLIGGYLTYRIGVKGGQEALDKKLSNRRSRQAARIFRRYGFWSIAATAVCPPPFPIVTTLLVAGALQYPPLRFLAALALGRATRYALLAYLGDLYGSSILRWLGLYYLPLLYLLLGLAAAGALVALYYWRRQRRAQKSGSNLSAVKKAA